MLIIGIQPFLVFIVENRNINPTSLSRWQCYQWGAEGVNNVVGVWGGKEALGSEDGESSAMGRAEPGWPSF